MDYRGGQQARTAADGFHPWAMSGVAYRRRQGDGGTERKSAAPLRTEPTWQLSAADRLRDGTEVRSADDARWGVINFTACRTDIDALRS